MGHKSGVLYGDMAFVFLLSRAAVPGGENMLYRSIFHL